MNTPKSRLVIREARSGEVLADAEANRFTEIEGNWYVDPSAVNTDHLRITEHEFRCPYRGRCLYVGFDNGSGHTPRVAWIYDDVKPGWEHIRGKYGFYARETARKLGKTRDDVL